MQILPVERLRPGMILARTLYFNGRAITRAGTALTFRLIDQLVERGFRTVHIKHDGGGVSSPDISEMLSEETLLFAYQAVRESMHKIERHLAIEVKRVRAAVTAILDDVLDNRSVVLQLSEVRALNDYIFGHSVSVGALATLLGIHSGLDERELRVMATGALLHDVGKTQIPDAVWNKSGELSAEELQMVQTHAIQGFNLLRTQKDLDIRVAHVAYQHHERLNGTGYPRQLTGDNIHRFARIVSVADVFDALTTDRSYRNAWPIHRAIEYIQEQSGQMFDSNFVRVFLRRVAPYPVGSVVRLNTGERARVVRLNPHALSRPVVTVMDQRERILDLSQSQVQRIVRLCRPGEEME